MQTVHFFHQKQHPRELGGVEIEQFLTHLAVNGKVSASTQNQAKSALLFLYKEVLKLNLPWMENIVAAKMPQRLPVVLTKHEVDSMLAHVHGTSGLILKMVYGTGMRIVECHHDLHPCAQHGRSRSDQSTGLNMRLQDVVDWASAYQKDQSSLGNERF